MNLKLLARLALSILLLSGTIATYAQERTISGIVTSDDEGALPIPVR